MAYTMYAFVVIFISVVYANLYNCRLLILGFKIMLLWGI